MFIRELRECGDRVLVVRVDTELTGKLLFFAAIKRQVVVLVDVGTGSTQQPVTDARIEAVVDGEVEAGSFEAWTGSGW